MFKFDSVTVLNNYIRDVFASDDNLCDLELTGEISDFKVASSGHCYFKLKDSSSVVSCVMFRSYFMAVDFKPQTGDKVIIRGSAELYSPSGSYQIKATGMKKEGSGDLHEKFLKLFEKLQKEGLFEQSHKIKIPVLPKKIGVITSASGAVIHDIMDTLDRRNPHYHLVVYPAAVQGESCPSEICAGLKYFEDSGDVDVVIVARGGGSYEDLFPFNDESIARTIYDMTIPVISAIGHEVDYTICDYVADLRAPTPTAAAELVLGRLSDLTDKIDAATLALDIAITKFIDTKRQIVKNYADHKALVSPLFYAAQKQKTVSLLEDRMKMLVDSRIKSEKMKIGSLASNLESLNPVNVLNRGYSFVSDKDGKAIESVEQLAVGAEVTVRFADGSADASVLRIKEDQHE